MVDNKNVTTVDGDLSDEEIVRLGVKGLLLANGLVAGVAATVCMISGPILAAVGIGSVGLLSVLTVTQDWQL